MSDHLREISEATAGLLDRCLPRDEAASWDATAWRELSAAGLLSIAVPEGAGGGGGSLVEAAEVVRVAGAHSARLPVAEASLLASWLLVVARLPQPLGVVTCAPPTQVTAIADGDGWVLSGTARGVRWARTADVLVLLAHTSDGPLVVVVDPAETALRAGDDLAGDPRDDLDLTGVRVPATRAGLVPADTEESLRLRCALSALLLSSGAAQRVLDLTLLHVQQREQFGRPLARLQAVQHLCAELAGEVTALQTGTDAALLAVGSDDPTAWLVVASAKADADRSVTRLTAVAHQLHGAIGITSEHPLRRSTLRLWSWRDDGGRSQEWAQDIASRVLTPTAAGLWEQLVGR